MPRERTRECNCCMEIKTGVKRHCKTARCSYSMCGGCYSRLSPDATGTIVLLNSAAGYNKFYEKHYVENEDGSFSTPKFGLYRMLKPSDASTEAAIQFQELADYVVNPAEPLIPDCINPNTVFVHGDVQSGKTAYILDVCKKNRDKITVVILRNYLADRRQFVTRAKTEGLKVKAVSKSLRARPGDVLALLGNKRQVKYALKALGSESFCLVVDECDVKSHRSKELEEKAVQVVRTSATFTRGDIKGCKLDRISPPVTYNGIEDLKYTRYSDVGFMEEAVKTIVDSGEEHITLVVSKFTVSKHDQQADSISRLAPGHTVLVMNYKGFYLLRGGTRTDLEMWTVSGALQYIKDAGIPKKVFMIAGNMAARGVSFVSNDYSWHVTKQIFDVDFKNTRLDADPLTGPNRKAGGIMYQRLRLLGIFNNTSQQQLFCSEKVYEEIVEYVRRSYSTLRDAGIVVPQRSRHNFGQGRVLGSGACLICLSDVEGGGKKCSGCTAVYHDGCLDRWFNTGRRTCCQCRRVWPTENVVLEL
jgi:hypothetical protein